MDICVYYNEKFDNLDKAKQDRAKHELIQSFFKLNFIQREILWFCLYDNFNILINKSFLVIWNWNLLFFLKNTNEILNKSSN